MLIMQMYTDDVFFLCALLRYVDSTIKSQNR